jgi:membrane-associated protease RseP (regulator of RpoE activity)
MQQMDDLINYDESDSREVIQAELVEEAAPGGPWQWPEIRPVRPRQRRVWLPAVLFVATCLSTFATGMLMSDKPGWAEFFLSGLQYAAPVMTILLCHEMGHFIQAYRYGVYASFPHFIPLPPIISPFGTLGAFIVMEPRIPHRKALFDIGISGPLAGLLPTMIFLIIGLGHSTYGDPAGHGTSFGEPLLFQFLAKQMVHVPAGKEVFIQPMAFAGWVGLFITSLNLMPIGQLDGGHVLYSLLPRKANRIASLLWLAAFVIVLLKIGTLAMWLPMLLLVRFVLGTAHPPTLDDSEPLGIVRTVLGWLTLAFIIVGFTPVPIQL